MTRIAVLGSGAVGTSLATGLAAAGHRVLTGSTRPDRPRPADDPALAAGVRFTGHAEAAEHARIVFNTTPGEVSVALLRDLEPALRGRILVDVSNAAERSPEGFPAAPSTRTAASPRRSSGSCRGPAWSRPSTRWTTP